MERLTEALDVQVWVVTQEQHIDVTDRIVALDVRCAWLVQHTNRGTSWEKEIHIQLEVLGELPNAITLRSMQTAIQVQDRGGMWVGIVTETYSIIGAGRRTALRAESGPHVPAWASIPIWSSPC